MGLADWKSLVAEFEEEEDMRDWEMKTGNDPGLKKRVELAFIWMTAKNEIASSIMPIRIHEYFERGMNERKAYKAHVKRVNSIIEKLSRLGLCPRKIREGDEGAETRRQREAQGVPYKLDRKEGPLEGGKYSPLDADARVVPRNKKALWRQKSKSKDSTFCNAALIVVSAITPEEGNMSMDDAEELVANKDYKEMIKAFVEIGDEIREDFIKSADRGLVDDDDEAEDRFEVWMSKVVATWRKIQRRLISYDSGMDKAQKASNTKRKLVHEVLADLVKLKFARTIPDLSQENIPSGSATQSGQFQSCHSASQRSDHRSRCSSDRVSVRDTRADAATSEAGSGAMLRSRRDVEGYDTRDARNDYSRSAASSSSSRGQGRGGPWRQNTDRRGSPYFGSRRGQSDSSRSWKNSVWSDPGTSRGWARD